MKLQWMAGIVLSLSAVPLAAQWVQNPPQSFGAVGGFPASGSAQFQIGQGSAGGCPVSLKAQHKADGSMVRTSGGSHPRGVGQWLHLTLGNPQGRHVTSAQITVRGVANKPHMTEAASGTVGSVPGRGIPGAERTMTVPFSATADGQSAEADVWIPGVTAVQEIDLHSVSYADGGVWSSTSRADCRVTPDPFMLIAVR